MSIDRETVMKKLTDCGQLQLLRCWAELGEEEREGLLSQLAQLDFSCLSALSALNEDKSASAPGSLAPIPVMRMEEIEARQAALYERGLAALAGGEVGAVLLAGGMGTRLGWDGPKGTYDIGVTKPVFIFERLMASLKKHAGEAGRMIPLAVMTSEKNDAATRAFFKEHDFFGYDSAYVSFFVQDMAPAASSDGKVLLESKSRVATSPNGNGGWFTSLVRAGILEEWKKRGVRYLNVFGVDNVLQNIADPAFVGAVLASGAECGSKVVRKVSPDEKMGVMCLIDGRPSVIEYTEMTDELRNERTASGDYAYYYGVILNYLFSVEALERTAGTHLTYHLAHKKVPYLSDSGETVSPEAPNAYKFELFIFDLIRELDGCLAFEVEREKEFAPVKNASGVDSVESARALLAKNGIAL